MHRRNPDIFRLIEENMARGLPYEAASVAAFDDWAQGLVDRADDERRRKREEAEG